MRNFFNAKEKTTHIIIWSAMHIIETFAENDALTEEESDHLKQAVLWLNDFNEMTVKRFGKPYLKKVLHFIDDNELKFVPRNTGNKDIVSFIDDEILKEVIKDKEIECFDCEKCDHLNCEIYKLKVALDQEGNGKESGCPFSF